MSAEPVLPASVEAQLREWLRGDYALQPLAGDASVRAYYRVTGPGETTYMLAYYPDAVRSQLQRFVAASEAVSGSGRAPAILHHSSEAVLQRDLGDLTLFDVLQRDRSEGVRLYHEAVDLLQVFQQASADINPPFTADFFENELAMTREFYAEKLMGTASADSEALVPLFRLLCETIARHPYVLCHRDFHGQNIHIFNDQLYVIDYQDMRMGPDTYDLASLLRDRGVARLLGAEVELALVGLYAEGKSDEREAVRRRYFETLLQRSLKILGTFARQPIERGRMHYLDFIPATLESVGRCLAELPQFAALSTMFPMEFSLEQARSTAASLMA